MTHVYVVESGIGGTRGVDLVAESLDAAVAALHAGSEEGVAWVGPEPDGDERWVLRLRYARVTGQPHESLYTITRFEIVTSKEKASADTP